ncbi:4Fe-4S dicluster domain-containing protein [Raoultibacter phocaeensis]|uniref:4Fe-4S dicluster domain-containing protein n=1 Tax=Raoultibacter phocaeensis TaxID=2479841 RepID=UPI0011189F49|nr:4Fe-4S dicluster domain-containing protein [Raoultibacter phocaeensis]
MKVFVFDSSKCNGCYGCQLACKDEHWNNEWPPYAVPQPDTGHFWCKMTQVDHGQVPKVRVEYTPLFCNHCDNAPCIDAAPDAVYKREDGLVIVDPIKAKGNRALADACPYGAIYYNDELDVPQKCTGCAHLVDEGELPHCVDVCATGALRFGDESEFAQEIPLAEVLADREHGPRVYYLNRPHLFIGGEVWDPAIDEIIEGARVTLSGDADAVVESDEFGDFWFRRIGGGSYTVTVEAEGYESETRDIELTKSLNIGDIPMRRVRGNEVAAVKKPRTALDIEAPIGEPDVDVIEVGEVTAAMSVMSQAPDEDGGVMSTGGLAKN